MVIWLIGLSGSGKTTLGQLLYESLKRDEPATVFLDGDILRDVWGDTLGHEIQARRVNAHRLSHLSLMLDRQGINVVAAVLSIFPEWQKWNRDQFSDYVEVFLDPPLDELKRRDGKALYRRAQNGQIKNVVGVDIPFPRPACPDITIDTSEASGGIDACLQVILDHLKCRS